jgi:hypothetical protein
MSRVTSISSQAWYMFSSHGHVTAPDQARLMCIGVPLLGGFNRSR